MKKADHAIQATGSNLAQIIGQIYGDNNSLGCYVNNTMNSLQQASYFNAAQSLQRGQG